MLYEEKTIETIPVGPLGLIDLLIIDDLGTELNNSFTSSQLFYCINERLNSSKSTIISTNHPLNELRDRYTERVTSRLINWFCQRNY